jgi:transcriptional accessory protein Tex/SPT6
MKANTISPLTGEAHRAQIIQKAVEKYVHTKITNNVTDALRMYLQNDAGPSEQIPLYVTAPLQNAFRTVLAKIRPLCEDCGTGLNLKIGAVDQTGKHYKTAWICPKCNLIEYSDRTPEEWLKDLNDEIRRQADQTTHE